MSTTIKRVALVAVAALTLGVVSVAPSTAAINQDTLTLSAATAAQTTAETATATSAVATLSFLGTAGDSASVTAALVSGPAGNTALPYLALTETSSAQINEANTAAGTVIAPNTAVRVNAGSSSAVTTAKFKVYLGVAGSPVTAPTKAGTYVVKLTPASVGASGSLLGATAQTLTITVTAAPTLDTVATTATVVINSGETNTATTDASVTYPKAASLANSAATITVALKNAGGFATTGESYTATISGPGLLGSATFPTGSPAENGASATGRALTVKAGDIVAVFPDGTSGVSTVTINSAAGVILATKTLTFYGDAASITASTTALTTGTVAAVGSNAKLISFKVADAAGTAVKVGTFYLVSADVKTVSNTYTACNAYNSTDGFTCDVAGVAKGTTTVYVTNRSSATDTTAEVKSATVSVRVGTTTPASVSVTTDKSTYSPGEKATITVTVKDADGNVVPSGTYTNIFKAGGIVAGYTLGSASDTTTASSVDGAIDGVKTFTVYMPATEGDVSFSWTTGSTAAGANAGLATANQAVKGTLVVSVSSASTSAAIDAANEAAQAASDATDAALAAADAADAATTKAQEAVDAVATLSAQVSKLITALKAQITTLTNLVIKIQKKVKA